MRHASRLHPLNRFERTHIEPDAEHLEADGESLHQQQDRKIEYIPDASKSIVSENRSPDIPFRYSVNPYRGCVHACSYCYARPGHEFLGYNAGLDFETKIVVKHDAPRLLREFLVRETWRPEAITFSGVTDCYQPAEREFRLTRQCLEVAHECHQPICIVTKNALVLRDLDILQAMASDDLVHVLVSVTTLSAQLARDLEPRTSIPVVRLRTIDALAAAGVPVGVMVAPVIPALNDSEIPTILAAAKAAGAMAAGYILLRLPLTVEPVFREWLERTRPLQADKVLRRVRETRGGKMNDSTWGQRMVGSGELAHQINQLFHLFKQKHGLDAQLPPLNCHMFRPPVPAAGQRLLF